MGIDRKKIGERIRDLRECQGKTSKYVSEYAGFSKNYLAFLENDEYIPRYIPKVVCEKTADEEDLEKGSKRIRLEGTKKVTLDIEQFMKLANLFGVTFDYLVFGKTK